MGTRHSLKLQHYWNLTIRLLNVVSRTFVGGVWSYPSAKVQSVYSSAPANWASRKISLIIWQYEKSYFSCEIRLAVQRTQQVAICLWWLTCYHLVAKIFFQIFLNNLYYNLMFLIDIFENCIQYFIFYFSFSEKCRDALGMQTMEIPDSAIVASSSYDKGTVGPKNARWDFLLNFCSKKRETGRKRAENIF